MISIRSREEVRKDGRSVWMYTISLTAARHLLIEVDPEKGTITVLQNDDGSTVHTKTGATFPDYEYHEREIVEYVWADFQTNVEASAIMRSVCERKSGSFSGNQFQDYLDNLLGVPKLAPRHGHCGHRMVANEFGRYYCKHCQDLAEEEKDFHSDAARNIRLKGNSLFSDPEWDEQRTLGIRR